MDRWYGHSYLYNDSGETYKTAVLLSTVDHLVIERVGVQTLQQAPLQSNKISLLFRLERNLFSVENLSKTQDI